MSTSNILSSISAILANSLNLQNDNTSSTVITINPSNNNSIPSNDSITASNLLRNELKRRQERESNSRSKDEIMKVSQSSLKNIDPLLQQISHSSTDPPKYWNNISSFQLNKNKKVKNSMKPLPIGNKLKQVKKQKGEAYQDRLNKKLLQQNHRKNLKK